MLKNQILPIFISFIVFVILAFALNTQIHLLNFLPLSEKISTTIQVSDVLVGLTIYLKTAIDFALLIGVLMTQFPGLKNRLAIDVGTSVGNAVGTMVVLVIWTFFKEVTWLLALMVTLASLVLFKLAEASLEHIEINEHTNPSIKTAKIYLEKFLVPINKLLNPFLSRIVPDLKFQGGVKTFKQLLITSFTIPFILGLDDFAGYVPLFNVVNVFGFGIGVFLGHCLLLCFLFLNPKLTTKVIKNPVIAIIGSVAFVLLALWGLYEAGLSLSHSFSH